MPVIIVSGSPESGVQNETVVRAYCQAAKAYSEGGYSVYLDGVVGPWMFSLIAPVFPLWDFVLLHAPLDVALSRLSACYRRRRSRLR